MASFEADGCCVKYAWIPNLNPQCPTSYTPSVLEFHRFEPVPYDCTCETINQAHDYSPSLGYLPGCHPWRCISAQWLTARSQTPWAGPGTRGTEYHYCGDQSRACCVGTACATTNPRSCWAQGGTTVLYGFEGWFSWNPSTASIDWWPNCAEVSCQLISCCIITTTGGALCRYTQTEQDCLQWPGAASSYIVRPPATCATVCGDLIPCCLSNGSCMMYTYPDCDRRGGVPAPGHPDSCAQAVCPPPPPPQPCCLCGGLCAMLPPSMCLDRGGTPLLYGDTCEPFIVDACRRLDPRPPDCSYGVFMVVPSPVTEDRYTFFSTAPLPDMDYHKGPEYHWAHAWDVLWECNIWDSDGHTDYNTCGFDLNIEGRLGDCIPDGYAGFVCGWQPPCP